MNRGWQANEVGLKPKTASRPLNNKPPALPATNPDRTGGKTSADYCAPADPNRGLETAQWNKAMVCIETPRLTAQ